MNYAFALTHQNDFAIIKQGHIPEVLIGHRDFSTKGTLDDQQFLNLVQAAKKLGLKIVFEWDVLVHESNFQSRWEQLRKWLPLGFDAIRVQDPGVALTLFEQETCLIQLMVATGYHNTESVLSLEKFYGARIDRFILSNEIPLDQLMDMRLQLKSKFEVMVLGSILIFYSSRKLLSPLTLTVDEKNAENMHEWKPLSLLAKSEESPHRGFQVVENQHGSFMYYPKDLSLLDQTADLLSLSENFVGLIDLRGRLENEKKEVFGKIFCDQRPLIDAELFKKNYPVPVIRGFFQKNNTDKQFVHLTNQKTKRQDDNYLGQVIDVQKNDFLVIQWKTKKTMLTPKSIVRIVTPDGKEKNHEIKFVKNSALQNLNVDHPVNLSSLTSDDQILLVNYCAGVSKTSVLYLHQAQLVQ